MLYRPTNGTFGKYGLVSRLLARALPQAETRLYLNLRLWSSEITEIITVPGSALSRGLVVSGANLLNTPTDLRLSDLEQYQKMMLSAARFHVIFIFSVSNTGTRLVIWSVLVAMYGRQDRTALDDGIDTLAGSSIASSTYELCHRVRCTGLSSITQYPNKVLDLIIDAH